MIREHLQYGYCASGSPAVVRECARQLRIPVRPDVVEVRLAVPFLPRLTARVRGQRLRSVASAVPVARPRFGRFVRHAEALARGGYAPKATTHRTERLSDRPRERGPVQRA